MTILRFVLACSILMATASLGACSSGDSSQGGGGSGVETGGAGGSYTPAEHPGVPEVINLGGPVLAQPKVLPILYASDPHAPDVEAFLNELSSTSYWGMVTAEYGVGALSVRPVIYRSEAPPATILDSDLRAEIKANTTGASPPWGATDKSTIYLHVIPHGSVVDAGGKCCQDGWDGYHDEAPVGAGFVSYAVVCSCPGIDGPGVDAIQQLTVAMSHELVEASTDPFVFSDPAWGQADDDNLIWTLTTNGEVADLCEYDPNAFVVPAGSTYMVHQSYSNAAAKAGKDPCLPAQPGPYFAAAPVLTDTLLVPGVPFYTKGVKLAVGQSKTIDVALFSEGPTGEPWKVTADDFSLLSSGTPTLELSLDKSEGQNGDTLKLTIKLLALDPQLKVSAFILRSDLGDRSTLWMGAVGK